MLIQDVHRMVTFEEKGDEPSVKHIQKYITCTPFKFCTTNVQAAALTADRKFKNTPHQNGGAITSHLQTYQKRGEDAFIENMKMIRPKEGKSTQIEPTGTDQNMLYLVVLSQGKMDTLEKCCRDIIQKALKAKYQSIGFDIFSTDKPFQADLEQTIKHMANAIISELQSIPSLLRPLIVLYKTNTNARKLIRDTFRHTATLLCNTQPEPYGPLLKLEGKEGKENTPPHGLLLKLEG